MRKLKIVSRNYKNIKGIKYMIINAQITYITKVCTKYGYINEGYSIIKNGNKIIKVPINRA